MDPEDTRPAPIPEPEATVPVPAPPPPPPAEPVWAPIVGWGRAVALGVRDTAQDILAEARRGASEARDEAWHRYRQKTKYRRHPED